VDRRFATIHPRTQRVLQAAVLLGRRVDAPLLGRVTGLNPDTVLAALRQAVYAQLVEVDGPQIRFRRRRLMVMSS